jgi:hypothetical protein
MGGSQKMLVAMTLSGPPGTDLGYLLHGRPSGIHTVRLAFGRAHVFYQEATSM